MDFLSGAAVLLALLTFLGILVLIFRKPPTDRELLMGILDEARSLEGKTSALLRTEINLLESRSASQRQEFIAWMGEAMDARFSSIIKNNEPRFAEIITTLKNSFDLQNQRLDSFQRQLASIAESNEKKLDALRETVDRKLASLQQDNNAKLESMRQTVEEKLQSTLESKLKESFQVVSSQLQAVHTAMGDMQNLAKEVGSIKTLMSNVKDRGGWGEFQLASILEQFLQASQFESNVVTKEGSSERVEFAIKLPGDELQGVPVWLPIDAKFPKEDYERLAAAIEASDTEAQKTFRSDLNRRLKGCAKDIRDKYINPPATTDFAIMFLPTEGLYAEALREPGLADTLQREFRVVIAGPSTLVALLNSLQMGFRTLAIQKRSSEVWEVLGSVKTEFDRFGEWLGKVRDRVAAAARELDKVDTRARMMRSKLKNVDAAPAALTTKHLGESPLALEEPEEKAEREEIP